MASYTLTIYNVPQENKNIELSYNSNDGHSTGSTTIENTTWTFTLQNLSYSKAIYKPGELIFKLQLTGCSGVNAIYSTFKGKKVELVCKESNNTNNIAKGYYIFGIQVKKKADTFYVTFQAYDPFKYLTLDTYCKAYTGKKFIQDIFLNKKLWPNTLPEAIDKQLTIVDAKRLINEREAEKTNLEEKQKILDGDSEKGTEGEIKDLENKIAKEKDENTAKELLKTLVEKKTLSNNINTKINNLKEEIKKLNNIINEKTKSQFNQKPCYLYYADNKEFIQPYLVQYNESFFDFLVRVCNRCGEFLYYEDGFFNIGLNIEKDNTGRITSKQTSITEYVSVNFSNETTTAWKENYIVNKHHNYADGFTKTFPYLDLNEAELKKDFGENYKIINDNGKELTIKYKIEKNDKGEKKDEDKTDNVKRSKYEQNKDIMLCQNSHLTSDENLVSLPPKDKYTKWEDFALWPGYFFINTVTDIANSADILEAIGNLFSDVRITKRNCSLSAETTNNDYEKKNFNEGAYIDERQYEKENKEKRINPFSTSEVNKNSVLNSYVTFSLEFYEAVHKGIEANERSRIQIALGDYFYPLALGSLIELDGQKYIVVQMNGRASNDAETLDIEAIPYKEDELVFPPAAPISPIREAKAQRAFITHNADPLKINRVRVRYPWQGQTEDPTPWIRIALPMASDGSGFNFLPQIGDEAIINYENGNIEKPYVEGMLYKRAEAEEESTVPYAFKRDKARVISSVNGHSIIFSDPPASSDAFNSISPLMSTIKSFVPTGFIKAQASLKGHKVDIFPDSIKKAMGGIEFTDEHGLYSISMSSDKRAISIDSPLGKVNINAFTGITISAPNGNVRIEGKNIDIVAGNNLSISSGNNIASHFWPVYRDKSIFKGFIDSAMDACKTLTSNKLAIIDMNLIRTAFETIVRPCGGTMLIKSNRYLCFEAGKGETQIAGRQTVKQLGMGATGKLFLKPDQLREVTIRYQDTDKVATNRIPIHINNVIQAIQAAKEAFDTINANISRAKDAYIKAYSKYIATNFSTDDFVNPVPQDFNTLYPNNIGSFNKFKMQNEPGPNLQKSFKRFTFIKNYVEELNKNAIYIKDKRLTDNKIWNDFKEVYLQDTVVKRLISLPANTEIENNLKNLFENFTTRNYLTHGPSNLNVAKKRRLVYKVLKILINNQSTTEIKDSIYKEIKKIRLSRPELIDNANAFINVQDWNTWCDNKIAYEGDASKLNKFKEGGKEFGKELVKRALGIDKLRGMLDQYIWDTNEDAGKILFSDQEGETLNFQNKEIHYYKKSETDPLAKLKQILRSIQ